MVAKTQSKTNGDTLAPGSELDNTKGTTVVRDVAGMVAEGKAQLLEIQAGIDTLESRISDTEEAIEAIHDGHELRGANIAKARAEYERLAAIRDQALGYAKLAFKLPHQDKATREASAAKKAADQAQTELNRLIAEDEAAFAETDGQEAELHKKKHLLMAELEARRAELTEMHAGMERALREMGQERFDALMTAYDEAEAHVQSAKHALVLAMINAHDVHNAALSELTDWPDLQRAMVNRVPADDATLRVLEATRLHVQTLIDDIQQVPLDAPGLPWRLVDQLIIREQNLFNIGELAAHRQRLEQTITAYRQHLATA